MRLSFAAEDEVFREELRTFIAENCPTEATDLTHVMSTNETDEDGAVEARVSIKVIPRRL